MPSLISSIRIRLLDKLGSLSPGGWKTLVVDGFARDLLDHVVGDNDILELNVTVIDPLQSARRPDPSLPVVYLVLPTTQAVHRILADFASPSPGYAAAHVVFLDVAPDALVGLLTAGIPSMRLKSVEELFLHFWPREHGVFLSRQPWSTFTLFGAPASSQLNAEIAKDAFDDDLVVMSRTIINLLVHLAEDPAIRYYAPLHHGPLGPLSAGSSSSTGGPTVATAAAPAATAAGSERWRSALSARSSALGAGSGKREERFVGEGVSKLLAEMIGREIAALKRVDDGLFTPKGSTSGLSPRPKATLFVVDRSIDPVAPWPHEFTYQAMVSDLLPLEDGLKYRYDFQAAHGQVEKKDAVLSERDGVWTDVRHLHMRDAIDRLMGDFNGFLKEHGGFSARAGAVTLNDMKDMLANLPQFQDLREKFSLHLSMAQSSMDLFESKRLAAIGMVEQNCATSVTPEGKTPKSLVEDMIPLLGENEAIVTRLDKVRIIALYIMYKDGVPDEDRRRLFQHAKLNIAEQDAINNLVLLGQKVVKNPGEREAKRTRFKQKPSGQEEEYELSRYKPAVRTVLEEHVANQLDGQLFPYLPSTDGADANGTGKPAAIVPSSFKTAPTPPPGPMQSASGSLRSQRPNWHRAGTTGSSIASSTTGVGSLRDGSRGPAAFNGRDANRQRLIIFVAGGVTYSEMRSAYQVGQALGKEVIIGSTHIITPESFIKDLKSLGKPGIGARPPNFYALDPSFPLDQVQPPRSEAERFQVVLDKMHWTTFVPPLLPPPPPSVSAASSGGKGGRDVRMASPAPSSTSSGHGQAGPAPPGKEEKKKKKKGFLSRF